MAERGPGRPGSGAFRKGPGSQAQCHHDLGIDLGGGEQVRHPDLFVGPVEVGDEPRHVGPEIIFDNSFHDEKPPCVMLGILYYGG